eukprot:tig00000157_g9606.t1
MFEIKKVFTFESAHHLVHHEGKCRRPHGHSYVLKVRVRADDLVSKGSSTNMVMDFSDISKVVKPMVDSYLDHQNLNETLNNDSPSAEFIARWIYRHLKPQIPGLYSITVCETATASATYWE